MNGAHVPSLPLPTAAHWHVLHSISEYVCCLEIVQILQRSADVLDVFDARRVLSRQELEQEFEQELLRHDWCDWYYVLLRDPHAYKATVTDIYNSEAIELLEL